MATRLTSCHGSSGMAMEANAIIPATSSICHTPGAGGCRTGDSLVGVASDDPVDSNGDLAACRTPDGSSYDNRLR